MDALEESFTNAVEIQVKAVTMQDHSGNGGECLDRLKANTSRKRCL